MLIFPKRFSRTLIYAALNSKPPKVKFFFDEKKFIKKVKKKQNEHIVLKIMHTEVLNYFESEL